MGNRRGELVEDFGGAGVRRHAAVRVGRVRPLGVGGQPGAAVVDVDDAAGAADGDPAVAAEEVVAAAAAAQREHRGAHGAVVDPARAQPLRDDVPLANLTVLAGDGEAVTICPPGKVGDAAAGFDACLRLPLEGSRIEDVYVTTTLARGSQQCHILSVGGKGEALHATLFLLVAVDTRNLFDSAGREVPDMEVAAARTEEDTRIVG